MAGTLPQPLPAHGTHRYVVLPSTFGPREVVVEVRWCWNYDGTLDRVEGVLLEGVPGSYLWEAGDRCYVTAENLVPLVRRVNVPGRGRKES